MNKTPRLTFIFAPIVLALGAAAGSAQAQIADPAAALTLPDNGRGNFGIAGAALRVGTGYLGSDNTRVRLLPVLGYYWANGWFASTTQGLGVNLSSTPGLQFGPRLTVDLGRSEHRAPQLAGTGDVNPRAELGGFLNLALGESFGLTSSLRAGSGNDHDGVRLDLGLHYKLALAPGLGLRLGAGTTLANAHYAQSYYGISATQSASSGYAVYSPKGGVMDVSASATLNYALGPRTTLTTGLTVRRLVSDAKASPLDSKPTSNSGQVGLIYAF